MKKLLVLLCALAALSLHAEEYIASFSSDITVNADATMDVCEMITVKCEGDQIKRGIVREFPTRYTDKWGTEYVVSFDLKSVARDGKPAIYDTEYRPNGIAVYIRQQNVFLAPGFYTFEIRYKTNRQLGFFDSHDELYWNVTGNGWRLPIKKVTATIHLPESIPTDRIQAQALTGYADSSGGDYRASFKDHTVTITSTRSFHEYEGLTIVSIWPKGYIQEPASVQQMIWFLRDNLAVIWLIITMIMLLLVHAWYVLVVRRANKPGTIIPLFYPPKNFGPAEIGYIKQKAFSDSLVTAQMVDLAVRGYFTIESQEIKHFFSKETVYTLKRTERSIDDANLKKHEQQFLKKLFGYAQSITLKAGVNETLLHAKTTLNSNLNWLKQFWTMYPGVGASWLITLATFFIGLFLAGFQIAWLFQVALAVHVVLNFGIAYFNAMYTSDGRGVCDEIDGFKLYLTTAELDRIYMIGTPPTKTPELYEYYLPYAIALGVEYAWTAQFQTLFADLERAGHPYRPLWYRGYGMYSFNRLSTMQRSLTASMRPVSSASGRPGRSSGWGGGGRSGGGGGGGGGGGC